MKQFFKDFAVYGIASVVGKVAAILLMPVYTSILTREEYGVMALITSCKGIIDLVSNLNIHSGIARDYYETQNRNSLVSTGFFSILLLSLFVLCIGLSTTDFWAYNVLKIDKRFLPAFVLMLFSIPCGSLQSYFAILTRFNKKSTLFAIGSIIQVLVSILISIVGVVVLRKGISSVFFGLVVSEVVATVFFAIVNKQFLSFSFDFTLLKRALLFSIPTLPAILAGWMDSSIGQIVIGRFVSMESLGVYSVALSFVSVFTLISNAFNNVWSPYLYENYSKDCFRSEVNKVFRLLLVGVIYLSVLLSLFSKELVLLLSNNGYVEAAKYIIMLCFPVCVYLFFPVGASGITISRNTKYIGLSYMFGSLLNLIMLLLVVPRAGIIAVPLCLAVSRVVTYFGMYIVSERHLQLNLPNYLFFVLLILLCLCYFIVVKEVSLIIRVGIMLLSTVCVLLYFSKRNILTLNSLLSRQKK